VLAREKAILTKLEAIEEMAGMNILCSDKTGTLTQNKLTLGEPALFGARDAQELIMTGWVLSRRLQVCKNAGSMRFPQVGWTFAGFSFALISPEH